MGLWGFRLGPTDGLHSLLTSAHCPFNLLRSVIRMRVLQGDEICFTSMDAIFKNDRSKLKRECTDVKSGRSTSVGPPQSQLKQNSPATVPF